MKCAVLLGHLDDSRNEGNIVRTAEAFGINLIFNVGSKKNHHHTSRGADGNVTYMYFDDLKAVINYVKMNNMKIVCIENTDKGVSIEEADYPANCLFVTGHESLGVPKEMLDESNMIVKIPQAELSYTRCLNTANALAIILNDWFTKETIKRRYDFK